MQSDRGKVFEATEPELTDGEIRKAQDDQKIVLSFKGKPVLASIDEIGFLAVKFALADGTFETVLFDRFAGETLWQLFQSAKQIEWKTAALRPGPGRH